MLDLIVKLYKPGSSILIIYSVITLLHFYLLYLYSFLLLPIVFPICYLFIFFDFTL